MSLDLHLYDSSDNEVAWVNWLRNPFGLCNWAEDNVGDGQKLWHVCNSWCYDKSGEIDRELFRTVVGEYARKISVLKEGFFFFDLPNYRQFIEPNMDMFPVDVIPLGTALKHIEGSRYDDRQRLAIPMGHFAHPVFRPMGRYTLKDYRGWFGELVRFAELLQNKSLRFSGSN